MHGITAPVSARNLRQWWESTHKPHQQSNCVCTQGGVCGSVESLVRQLQLRGVTVSRSTVFRRLSDGGTLTMEEADRFAVALGTTPYRIWPAFDRAPVTASLAPCGTSRNTLF